MDRLKEYVIKHSACSMPRCEYVENSIEIDCDKCQELMLKEHDAKVRADTIDEIYELADERMKDQINYLEQNTRRNGKMWAKYMNTYLGHVKVACKQLKEKKNENI